MRVSPQGDTAADAQPEDVVICGLSGRLPESNNIEEFRQHLINGEDMVTEDDRRWTPGKVSRVSLSPWPGEVSPCLPPAHENVVYDMRTFDRSHYFFSQNLGANFVYYVRCSF